jgi:hypothetical protein
LLLTLKKIGIYVILDDKRGWRRKMFKTAMKNASEIMLLGFLILLCVCVLYSCCFQTAEAYYGIGLFGRGIYGSTGLYGIGGLYGSSLFGLSGLYGGIGSLYGLGGLYGLLGVGSLYGIGGFYGMGGLYNPSSLYTIGLIYGLGGSEGLKNFGGLSGILNPVNLFSQLNLLNPGLQLATPITPAVSAEQAGTWTGSWYSLIKLNAGLMNMSLIEDTVKGTLVGEVTLLLNKITNSIPAEIGGLYSGGTTFVLTGGNNTVFSTTLLTTGITLYEIELNCTLTSSTTMTGTYFINDLVKLLATDYGNFNLTLASPAI